MNTKITGTIGGLALLLSSVVMAEDASLKNTFRAGVYFITYHVQATDISGPMTPAGLNAKIDSNQTLYLAYVRSLTKHLDLEFAFGVPPTTKTKGKGPATLGSVPFDGVEISSAKWASPTILLNYVFFDETARFRPYIGIGVNHTAFYERRSTAGGDAVAGGPTRISLTASTGIAGTVGLSYRFNNDWHLYASYSASRVTSDLKADTAGLIRTSHLNFRPRTFVLSAGYSF
ncbi:MAG: OmpW family protein [Proteobacteria bacterium]|nr:OmpW family protein [Pseudomonadota bacterium]